LVDAGVQQPDLSAEKCKTGNDHDR
jgi:hypothetical protein